MDTKTESASGIQFAEVAEIPTLLIVDDSRLMRYTLKKILNDDFNLVEAVDGEDGWEKLLADPNIQGVFSDLSMPNLDGYGLLERIRNAEDQRISKLPFIVITGKEGDDETLLEEVRAHGGNDVVSKPFNSEAIISKTKTFLATDSQSDATPSQETIGETEQSIPFVAEETAHREAEAEAQRNAEQAARQAAEEAARHAAEQAAAQRREAEAEAQRNAEQAARQAAEEAARRAAEQAAAQRREAEAEAQRKAEQAARQAAEEAARHAAEQAAAQRREAEAEAQRKAEQAARQAAEEAARRAAEQAEAQRREAEAEAQRNAEQAARQAAEEAARHAAEQAEALRREAEAEAQRNAEQAARQAAEEAVRHAAEQAEAKRREAEAEAQRNAEQAARQAAEEAERFAEEKAACNVEEIFAQTGADDDSQFTLEEVADLSAEQENLDDERKFSDQTSSEPQPFTPLTAFCVRIALPFMDMTNRLLGLQKDATLAELRKRLKSGNQNT